MPLINSDINFDLNWSKKCVMVATDVTNQAATFSITNAKLYVPVLTLLTQDNTKLLGQLGSDFNRTVNWNKYQSKISTERPDEYLDYLIDPSFQGVNSLFVLSFENKTHQISYNQYFLPTIEIKDYNVMIGVKNFFDQPVKNNLKTYDSIRKFSGCLLDYNYFKDYSKKIAIDLSI